MFVSKDDRSKWPARREFDRSSPRSGRTLSVDRPLFWALLLLPSSTKREIRQFHVVVVQRLQRNVQKKRDARAKLLFACLNLSLKFSMPPSSSLRKLAIIITNNNTVNIFLNLVISYSATTETSSLLFVTDIHVLALLLSSVLVWACQPHSHARIDPGKHAIIRTWRQH